MRFDKFEKFVSPFTLSPRDWAYMCDDSMVSCQHVLLRLLWWTSVYLRSTLQLYYIYTGIQSLIAIEAENPKL